jgi:hypothetical protein
MGGGYNLDMLDSLDPNADPNFMTAPKKVRAPPARLANKTKPAETEAGDEDVVQVKKVIPKKEVVMDED